MLGLERKGKYQRPCRSATQMDPPGTFSTKSDSEALTIRKPSISPIKTDPGVYV